MSSNYAFAFTINRRALVPPASQPALRATVAAVATAAAAPINATNRFSINRLMHAKSSGGCRSCN